MNCKIIGYEFKRLEVDLLRGEEFYAEKGALIYLERGIDKQPVGNGNGGLGGMIAARLSGERFFSVRYCNLDPVPRKLVLGGKGNLLPIKMDGREVMCRRGVYVASSRRIDIGIGLSLNRIIGGTSGFLQTLRGEGTVFLECIGAPIELDLAAGQTIEADENHLVATQGIPEQNIRPEWSLKNFFGGEGLSLLHITGPGKVYLNP